MVKLASRKFELSIFHQQKTTRKGWLFVGGSCCDWLRFAPPTLRSLALANRRSPERLSLVVKLASRKFELSIFHQQKNHPQGVAFCWWILQDSNLRPDRYERPALTN